MFAAVDREPALPHCVTALAGPITTFKLHNTLNSHGCMALLLYDEKSILDFPLLFTLSL